DALLDDSEPRWPHVFDIAKGVVTMRWKQTALTVGCALLGGVVAAAIAQRMPVLYVSSAVLQLRGGNADGSRDGTDLVRNAWEASPIEATSRAANMSPESFRQRVTVTPVVRGNSTVFTVKFAGSDSASALRVTQQLTGRLIDANLRMERKAGDQPSLLQ